jgi:hypothetical protein
LKIVGTFGSGKPVTITKNIFIYHEVANY